MKFYSVKTGDIVVFGHYEQDGNTGNGAEEIEWIVLDVRDGKALLLSRYGLEAKPYNAEYKEITWENCTLRAWLNGDFLKTVFNADEQSAILTTNVDNSSSQGYSKWSTSGGNNTQDKIFLLSYAEANRYLGVTYADSSNTESRVKLTTWAIKNGAYTSTYKTSEGDASGWWWLRSPGDRQKGAARVNDDGSLSRTSVHSGTGTIRPAFWIDVNSGAFQYAVNQGQ